jgi:hypothetical protein
VGAGLRGSSASVIKSQVGSIRQKAKLHQPGALLGGQFALKKVIECYSCVQLQIYIDFVMTIDIQPV